MKELLRKGTQQELAEVFRVASELRGFSAAARVIGQAHHVIQRTAPRIVDTHEQAQAELEQTPIGELITSFVRVQGCRGLYLGPRVQTGTVQVKASCAQWAQGYLRVNVVSKGFGHGQVQGQRTTRIFRRRGVVREADVLGELRGADPGDRVRMM